MYRLPRWLKQQIFWAMLHLLTKFQTRMICKVPLSFSSAPLSFLRSPFFSPPQQNSAFVSWKWTWKQCWGEEHTHRFTHTDTHTGWGRPHKRWKSSQSCTMISSHLFLRRTILRFVFLYVGNRHKQKDRPIHFCIMVTTAKQNTDTTSCFDYCTLFLICLYSLT